MPYIVTTKQRSHDPLHEFGEWGRVVSRRAVATLDEARNEAIRHMPAATGPFDARSGAVSVASAATQARALPESGGTVGPLPDGTLIEVERVSDFFLRDAVPHSEYTPESDLIAAYNAAQRVTA